MEISLDKKPHQLDDGTTIANLLQTMELRSSTIAIELNGQIIAHSEYPNIVLKSGDTLNVLHPVAGG